MLFFEEVKKNVSLPFVLHSVTESHIPFEPTKETLYIQFERLHVVSGIWYHTNQLWPNGQDHIAQTMWSQARGLSLCFKAISKE